MFGWMRSLARVAPEEARRRIRSGRAKAGMHVEGRLDLSESDWLTILPENLQAETVDVSNCRNLTRIPTGLRCGELRMRRTNIAWLPPDIQVRGRIDARDCRLLRAFPAIEVGELRLVGCVALEQLPEGLITRRLDVSGCTRLTEIPARNARSLGHLNVSGCTSLESLPEQLTRLTELDVSGCTKLQLLPDGMRVSSWIDVARSGLNRLPWSLRSATLRWGGVPVSDRIAFDPESITAEEVLSEPNAALRRVLLERIGMEKFVDEARAEVVDNDVDAGGERRLLRIRFDGGEHVACIDVRCPSTGHRYVLRVPPEMQSCRQAVAWTAGFKNPDDYQPVLET